LETVLLSLDTTLSSAGLLSLGTVSFFIGLLLDTVAFFVGLLLDTVAFFVGLLLDTVAFFVGLLSLDMMSFPSGMVEYPRELGAASHCG
jgi:hypothetical protein